MRLTLAFRTKSLTLSIFLGELSNVSSGGCGLLSSPKSPIGVSACGSEYFPCRCASKVSSGTLRTPFFPPQTIFSEFKWALIESASSFSFLNRSFLAFSARDMTRIFSFIFDNCCFIKVLSPGTSLSCFFRRLCSNLSWPFSLCLLFAVLLWLCWSSDPKCSNHTVCTIFVKECNYTSIDPFRLVRKMKDNSSSYIYIYIYIYTQFYILFTYICIYIYMHVYIYTLYIYVTMLY